MRFTRDDVEADKWVKRLDHTGCVFLSCYILRIPRLMAQPDLGGL
jgi:hypothetical protein